MNNKLKSVNSTPVVDPYPNEIPPHEVVVTKKEEVYGLSSQDQAALTQARTNIQLAEMQLTNLKQAFRIIVLETFNKYQLNSDDTISPDGTIVRAESK